MTDNHFLWDILREHMGHKVSIVCYGDVNNPADMRLECEDCDEVILDAGRYTLCERVNDGKMTSTAEFMAWFNTELQKYSLLAKSNSISLNEFCYVLRMSEFDFTISFATRTNFWRMRSVKESSIPSQVLTREIEIVSFNSATDYATGHVIRHVLVKILERKEA